METDHEMSQTEPAVPQEEQTLPNNSDTQLLNIKSTFPNTSEPPRRIPEFDIQIKYISPDGCIDGTQPITITVKRTDLIAAVKAKYVDSGKCPTPNYIMLRYKNEELLDQNTLFDYKISGPCVIYHEYINRTPYSAVDYHVLTKLIQEEAIKNKDYTKVGYDPELGYWDQEWTKGDEWKQYPNVVKFNIWDDNKHEALIRGQNKSFHYNEYPDRVFKSLYVTQVGDYLFQCIHKMEGKWNGDIMKLDEYGASDSLIVSEVELEFDPQGFWIEARKQVTNAGLVTITSYKYIPTGNGKLKITTSEGSSTNLSIEVTEMSSMLLVINAMNRFTNKPVYLETITLLDPMNRVRSVQHFSETGAFIGVDLMNEHRVLDQTSGALAKFVIPPKKPEQI